MAPEQSEVPEKALEVCARVKDLLLELGIGFTPTEHPDLVLVTEPETDIVISLDAQEAVVCLRIVVCPERREEDFYRRLLEANARIVHGHFQIENARVVLADNLEAENLDANELEASIASLVTGVVQNAGWLE